MREGDCALAGFVADGGFDAAAVGRGEPLYCGYGATQGEAVGEADEVTVDIRT